MKLFVRILTSSVLALCASAPANARQVPYPDDLLSLMGGGPTYFASWQELRQGCTWYAGETSIRWVRWEEAPNTTPVQVHRLRNEYTVSYRLSWLAARNGGDDLYVAGLYDNGAAVIEHWHFRTRDGGWQHRSIADVGMGNPLGDYAGVLQVKGGGPWTAPPNERHVAPSRRVLWEGTLGAVQSMNVDPEGRFLLFQVWPSHEVYQLRLDQDPIGPPALLTSPSEVPELDRNHVIVVLEHNSTDARIWAFVEDEDHPHPTAPLVRVVMTDVDNDGFFDSTDVLDEEDYRDEYVGTAKVEDALPTSVPWKR